MRNLYGRYFVFYSAIVPFLTIIHAILNIALYLMSVLQPFHALVGAVCYLCGWAIQVGFWTQCDLPDNLETGGSLCYQTLLSSKGLKEVTPGLGTAKVALGFVLLFL